MSSICQHCKEPAYDAEELVCKACGIVTEDIEFGAEYNPHSSNIKYKSHLWHKNKRPPSGLTHGLKILNELSNVYNIRSDIKEEVIELLNHVYSKKSFRRIRDVGVMAGCCLIHVQKRYQQFIPLTDLCAKLQCSKKTVFKFAKVVKLYCNKETVLGEPKDVDDPQETPSGSSEEPLNGLDSSIRLKLASFPEDSKSQLISKTKDLVQLAYSLWVGSGRSTEGVISAAAFLCWKSMHPSCRTLAFKQFCSDFSLPYLKARPRVSELKDMLLKLGQKIPSLTQDYVNKKNVLFHLNYILENSVTLRNDLLSVEFNAEEIDKKEFSAFRRAKVKKCESNVDTEMVIYDSDMRASDIEISDTEINSYLRTEKQVEMIKNLREVKKSPKHEI